MKDALQKAIATVLRNTPFLEGPLRRLVKQARPNETILLEYPVNPRPRYGNGQPLHRKLYEIIDRNRQLYRERLQELLRNGSHFRQIPMQLSGEDETEPAWLNPFLPSLDAAALYAFLSLNNPRRFFEIGSGNSTKFARRAIRDHGLRTSILSIDPHPRAEIDPICDQCVRQPVEDVALEMFDQLEKGDILFVDNSHRIFMNSDATAVFLDIIPRLKSGVLVQFHDIYLPYDYPTYNYVERKYWSEQYVLAVYLLAEGNKFEIVLPNKFISEDPDLYGIVSPLFEELEQRSGIGLGRGRGGTSFWIRMN